MRMSSSRNHLLIAVIVNLYLFHGASAWLRAMPRTNAVPAFRGLHPHQTRLLAQNKKDDFEQAPEESEDELKKRMVLVRSLQQSYYLSPDTGTDTGTGTDNDDDKSKRSARTSLDESTGQLKDLPLFRAPWWEVPGRSNVLNIHDPIYTNMVEAILRGPKPWCFGHLFLEGGSRNLKSEAPEYQLETWKTTLQTDHSAVLGCLMNISDYRRFADGRLLLLVHAMERFVVTAIAQRLPYSVVDAQILPDAEELDPSLGDLVGQYSEAEIRPARALAIQESVKYHPYEYDTEHKLQVPNRPDLDLTDIVGSDIAKVLPYCPFSKTLEPPMDESSSVTSPTLTTASSPCDNDKQEPSLEYQLLCQGIYQTPLVDPEFPLRHELTAEELERELWWAMNNFLIQTKIPVSPIVLGLMPLHHTDWWEEETPAKEAQEQAVTPSHNSSATATATAITPVPHPHTGKPFLLKQIVIDLASLPKGSSSSSSSSSVEHDFVLVSPDYPAHRRQRRLSYSAAHLLEKNAEVANTLRRQLLATPTTQQRLRLVLEALDQWQEAAWGEFQ